jgi:hypothetical protein
MVKIVLALSAIAWFGYGAYCFATPAALETFAGVAATNPTATIEIRAMYGGLQMAIGIIALLGLSRPALQRPALLFLGLLCGGLGIARLLGTIAAADISAYTGFALAFEFATAIVVAWLLSRAEHAST